MKAISVLIFLLAFMFTITPVSAEESLSNQDVLDMLGIGLAEEVIVAKIKTSACVFDTSIEALKKLKDAEVPDAILLAMVNASAADQEKAGVLSEAELSRPPRVFITSQQSIDIHGSGDWVSSTSALNSDPDIGQKVRERASEEGVRVEQTLMREDADLLLLFGREDKVFDNSYTWVLADAKKGSVLSNGKTAWFRNTVRDALHSIDAYWKSRNLDLRNERTNSELEPATLFIYRRKREGNNNREPPAICNGRVLARMDNGRFIEVVLTPGRYEFVSDDRKKDSVILELEEGNRYYLEMRATNWNGLGRFEIPDTQSAVHEIAKLKPLADKFIEDRERVVSRE